MSLITSYPAWYVLFCLAAGAVYTILLYRKEPLLNDLSVWLRRALVAFRFLTVSALAFLLLGPMLRTFSREVEKPIVVLAMDESASVMNSKDSVSRKELLKQDMALLQKELGDKFDVRTLAFGDKVRPELSYNFTDRQTDFSSLYEQMDVQFANRNVGAVVLATDGLYNEGASPVYGPSRLKVPVYSLALGDTTVRRDLYISAINHNRVAFLGNAFPLEVVADARQAGGTQTLLTVEEDSVQVFSRTLTITGSGFHSVVPVLLEAKSKGIHHYRIRLSKIEGEVTEINTVRDIFIEVVEQKERVLILSAAPNPDISAIRNTLETSPNYEVTVADLREFNGRIGDYNLVVLHSLPAATPESKSLIEKIKAAGVSVWVIMGANISVDAFNAAGFGLKLTQSNGQLNDVQPVVSDGFSLFSLSERLNKEISNWPPLKSPFGVYQLNGDVYPLLYQRIGSVNTSQPLLCFSETEGRKTAILTGEGIWRWKLAEFSNAGNHELSNELILGTVQYLSVKENRSPFRILTRNNFRENEPLIFDAQLYNQADQLVNEPEVRLNITNRAGKEFRYTMSRTEKAYHLDAGVFPVGYYRYKAEVKLGDKIYTQQGEFSVSALQMETAVTIADHGLLQALASRTGGVVYYPGKAAELSKALQQNEQLKSVSFMHKKLEDLLNEPWFFVLVILLLSAEWFVRKRSGSY